MNDPKRSRLHFLLLFSALALGFSFRLIRLSAMPLSNSEAAVALEALSIARGGAAEIGAFPAIVGLTGFDFFIFQPGNFLARFWGAFFSGLVVILPFLFRQRIGLWGATVASFILALSPEMVGTSRLIGTPMMAMTCLLLSLGFLFQRKAILLGLFLALGLMSGPGFWFGILVLGLSYLVFDWLFDAGRFFYYLRIECKKRFWQLVGLSFGLTLLVVGTGFFMAPDLISGVFSGLVEFVRGFFHPGSAPPGLRLLAFPAYAAGAVGFGLWGGIRGLILRNKLDLFLLIWAGFGGVFYLVYPGADPSYIIWASLPLWLLAARAFVQVWRFPKDAGLVVVGTLSLVVAASAFMLLALRTLIRPGLTPEQQLSTFIALIGGLILLAAVTLLVHFGWGEEVSISGLFAGLAVVLLAGLVSLSVNTTSLNPEESFELWLFDEPTISSKWLQVSIDRVLDWNEIRETPLDIVVADYENPELAWALHAYNPVDFVPYLAPQSRPGILITDVEAIPEIASAYRGQDLVWSELVQWNELTAFQTLEWLITRDAPTEKEEIILWVRSDLMPDDQFLP
jgi:hypothetical protein